MKGGGERPCVFLNFRLSRGEIWVEGQQGQYLIFKLCIGSELSPVASGGCCVNRVTLTVPPADDSVSLQLRGA